MSTKHLKLALQLTAALGLSAIGLSAHAANPMGCQAKGALYILENGKQTLLAVTPGAGTTAAASNQGHAGFKTDAAGKFTLSYPTTPLTPTQTYYFRMEVHNSQFLAYGISGLYGNTFKTMAQPVTGQVLCDGPTPSQAAGVNLGAAIAQTIPLCDGVNAGVKCNWFTIFEPNYYPNTYQNSYHATNAAQYNPPIPRCTQPAPSTAPATTINTGHLAPRCMRKFTFVRPGPVSYSDQIANGTAIELFPPN